MSYHNFFMRSASAGAVCAVIGAAAYANTPEAGSVIGNQAVATYLNASGDTITVTSNTVETIVQQVAGVTLTSDNDETIAPGGKAFLPHIITNDGNGPDSFDLTATENGSGTLDTTQLVFYPDADMDGVADSATAITTTPTLAPGEQFGVVIEAAVASNATGDETIAVVATSALTNTVTAANTDTLTISNDAIVELVKSMNVDASSGGDPSIVDAGDTVTITLTYSSTGLTAANNYVVEDVLDANLLYVEDSARWSDAPGVLDDDNATTAVDGTNGSGETIAWDYDDTQTVNFTLSSVGSGRSGSVTFEAVIASTANAGIIPNTATQEVDGVIFPPSNTASVTVDNEYSVAIADTAINSDGSPNLATTSATDDDTFNNDIVTETTDVYQGGTIRQEFVLTNLSNEADSLSVAVDNVDFPAGTTFRFVGADGVTPVIGSVGPLAIGESAKVTLLATLPSDVTPTAAAAYTATLTTTSDGSGVSDTSTAEFTGAVLAAAVDLENTDPTARGDGAFPTNGANPWISTSTDPGVPVTFDMLVENEGPNSESYNISLAQALPTGWTAEFRLTDGTLVSNTGTIPAGDSKTFQVIITPDENAAPGNTPIDIAIVSAVSGQGDRIVNQVAVNAVHDVQIIDDQNAQAAPGGIVDMLHTITNNGNVTVTEGSITETGLTNFSGAIFLDADGDGVVDPAETVIDNFSDIAGGLAPGESVSVIYRVQTPSTSTSGVSEIGTLALGSSLNGGTATDGDTTNNAVEDRVVIVSGDVTLTKYQYVDPTCTGAAGVLTKTRQDVEQGQCIRYRVEAENTGTADASNVTISDAAPAYTTITDCGGACARTVFPGGSTSSASSTSVSSSHGTILPGGFARLEFTVKVNE
ncbi:beta strand repeat-containing protein [Pseudooceanicola aestuarii]|uniref:beta strand repeat-containing protein n=1 Tax=Pseudooceanicola aestuarii TaxID=2697319 RepID=UPI001EF75D75|nr:NEW3 domain-containing protein [Pseudooceanicola aestuarii]